MSDPGYGDLSVNVNHDLKRVVGMCFVDLGTRNTRNRTRGNNAITQRVVYGSSHCCRVPVGTRLWFGCFR